MSIVRYNLTARSGGVPTAGLSPAWNTLVQSATGTVVASPATVAPITSLAGGGYQIAYDPAGANGELYGIVDFGASITDPNERYADISLVADPSNLANVAANVWGTVQESGKTCLQTMRLMSSVLLGKATVSTTSASFLSLDGTKPRVTATTDASGDRTAVTLDPS